ncbi:MAG: lipoyl synthase [Candidatus Omnitrophica bacterium]|nr:lipoyl synthase [Candidatus Omnitrophota bacterium]MDD5653623.1 lipoyl synthase [Candidatus Omnitrophota bacterium]
MKSGVKPPLQKIPGREVFSDLQALRSCRVHTVCQEAHCPNLGSCFAEKKLTFLILGDTCTRNCTFCAVKKTRLKKLVFDLDEPLRVARAVKKFRLKYAVITSVTRDDLEDGGAQNFARTIEAIHEADATVQTEVLIPDLQGKKSSLEIILRAHPQVLAHNLETVSRLYPVLRPQADYRLSLTLLEMAKEILPQVQTKSSLMLGLGEKEAEVISALKDLRENACDFLTLGQYLSPSPDHYPVKESISAGQFAYYRDMALVLGFKACLAGPSVRSSYKAEELYASI